MKVLALPRDDSNPYQSLLYGEMGALGTQVTFVGGLTPSHLVNLALLPVELAVRRLAGARVLHLHWVFAFGLAGAGRFPALRKVAQVWFIACLRCVRMLGIRLVWTAHNVLPHGQVFSDEVSARRALVGRSDLVIAHSPQTLAELAAIGALPRHSVVIPHGPFGPGPTACALRLPGQGGGPRRFLFFGKIRSYKGVRDLLGAFAGLPPAVTANLTVAGECDDSQERSVLEALASRCGERVELRFGRVPDEDIPALLGDADAVVLPFLRITTSGSALLALAHGRPLIVPALPALAHLPDQAVVRYDGTAEGLTAALTVICDAPAGVLAGMSSAARSFAASVSWEEIAERTVREMAALLGGDSTILNAEPAGKILGRLQR